MIGFGFSVFTLAIRQMLGFDPKSLFAAGEQGWVYDPSNLASLFQDAAGTTPVTAMEQPVGLQLDLKNGLALGPELVTFPNDPSKWIVIGANTVVQSGTGVLITNVNSAFSAYVKLSAIGVATTLGKRYKISFTAKTVSGSAGSADLIDSGNDFTFKNSIPSSNTLVVAYAYITANTNTYLKVAVPTTGGSVYVENISVRELPGNHRYQTTSANRPVVSARKNFYLATETLATQNVTTRAAKYIVSFWGTGSITLSGTATGTLTGTSADTRVYLEFTATSGTLTSTISGSVLKAQLEEV